MKKYLIYDNTGEIVRIKTQSHGAFRGTLEQGQFIIEGSANPLTEKVVNGKIVPKTAQEIAAIPAPKPIPPREKRRAWISQESWDDIIKRIEALEKA